MPEITDAEFRQFVRYQHLGTPEEVESKVKKIPDLEADNKKQRDEIRDLKEQAPKDGTVSVPKETADQIEAYTALGKPDDLKAKLEKVPTLEAELAKRDRETARDQAAKALGIEGKHLAPFSGSGDLTYETREEEVERNGKKEKVPVAYVKDAEGKEHKLSDFGKATWGESFEAVLEKAGRSSETKGTNYVLETGGKGTPGALDPAAIGRKMAEDAKASKGDESLAFR